MKLTFLGATETVTGSKYHLQSGNNDFLIDCGLFQGYKELRLRNWEPLPIDPKQFSAVLLTHAHIDHSGYLPLFVRNGFTGNIYATKATEELCSILLPDCGFLLEEDARRANKYGYSKHKTALPLYTQLDAIESLKYFKTVDYSSSIKLSNDLNATWYNASHILGASYIVCKDNKTSILFSGDLGRNNDPIMKPCAPPPNVDYIVIESTYGDRLHDKENPEARLEGIINSTIKHGGSIIIPAFAVGRAQHILYYIYKLKSQKKIPNIPVYLDSPMAIDATKLMCANSNEHKLSPQECAAVCKIPIYTRTTDESKDINLHPFPKVIISASGMATGGRILHHIKHYAPSHRNTILFAGFQAAGTRGEKMLNGAKEIRIHGMDIPIKARIEHLASASAHADYQELLAWLGKLTQPPKHIFITHGEIKASNSLKDKITDRFGYSCSVPKYLDTETL